LFCNANFSFSVYVVDAAVYGLAWYADSFVIKRLRIERGQDVPEVELGESYRVLPTKERQHEMDLEDEPVGEDLDKKIVEEK
jgi:hypothetical protein